MSDDQHANHQDDQPADHQTGYTIRDAAAALGVSENAIRQRIKRGTLGAVKVAGAWRVELPDHQPTTSRQAETTTATTTPTSSDQQALVDALQGEVDYLRRTLEDERTDRKQSEAELRRIVYELSTRAPALGAGQPEQTSDAGDDPAPQPPWWRFWRR